MAKKKTVRKKPPARPAPLLAIADTSELDADAANPRKISETAAKGLRSSLERFGDLSGIVWNKRTGELVCGHQRMQQIREKWGDQPIEAIDVVNGLGGIRVDDSHFFPVRIVDWTPAKQRAANVAANSQKISGQFTDSLTDYLLEIQSELQDEEPGLLDDVLLTDLIDVQVDDASPGVDVASNYQVLIECKSEEHQRETFEKLKTEGFDVKALTI